MMKTQRESDLFHIKQIVNEEVITKNTNPIHLYNEKTSQLFLAENKEPYLTMRKDMNLYQLEGLSYRIYTWKNSSEYQHWILKQPSIAELKDLKTSRRLEQPANRENIFIIENYFNPETKYFGRVFIVINQINKELNIRLFGYEAKAVYEL